MSPRNWASIRLPLPLLVVGVGPSVLLARNRGAKVGTSGVIERIRLIKHPFPRREITSLLLVMSTLNHNNLIFLVQPRTIIIVGLELRGRPAKETNENAEQQQEVKLALSHWSCLNCWEWKGSLWRRSIVVSGKIKGLLWWIVLDCNIRTCW